MNHYLILVLGVIAAGAGGELFVRAAVGMGQWARISPGLIGATIAALATSSPEWSVGISSALMGAPQISLGDTLGSNVVNIAVILGFTLLLGKMKISPDALKRDLPAALITPVLVGVLTADGVLSRADGIILLAFWCAWFASILLEAHKQRITAHPVNGAVRLGRAATSSTAGLGLLIVAGVLVVDGAKRAAVSFGISEYLIGAVIVATGTSVPEFATTIISRIRRQESIGYGTVLGSNICNGLLIVGTVAVICPIRMPFREVAVALIFGIATLLVTIPWRKTTIGPLRGVLLLVLYALYIMGTFF
jgi:cation:H+ antiporter